MRPTAPSSRASATNAPATAAVVAPARTRAVRGGIVAVISWLLVAAPAPAQDVSSTPSVDQYVESVPGAGGSKPTARRDGRRAELPPDARKRVRAGGGADAQALEDLATDPALGAPTEARAPASPSQQDARHAAPEPRPAPPGTSSTADGDGGAPGSRTVLLLGLFAIAAGAAAAAAARRRSATG